MGDWIPYVICKELVTDEKELVTDEEERGREYEDRPQEFHRVNKRYVRKITYRAEDPEYVKEHGLPIDYTYYLTNQLKKHLKRTLACVLGWEPKTVTARPHQNAGRETKKKKKLSSKEKR